MGASYSDIYGERMAQGAAASSEPEKVSASISGTQAREIAKKLRSMLLPVVATVMAVISNKYVVDEIHTLTKDLPDAGAAEGFNDILQHRFERRGIGYFLLNPEGQPVTDTFHSFAIDRKGVIFGIRKEGAGRAAQIFQTGISVPPHHEGKPTDPEPGTTTLQDVREVPLEGPQQGYNSF